MAEVMIMARINEHKTFATYTGEKVKLCRLEPIAQYGGDGYGAYADSKEYIISKENCLSIIENVSASTEECENKVIDFHIHLYIRDDIITGGHIFKRAGASEKSIGYETDATQQELALVMKFLRYITEE